ncbi:hypothetical protein Zmor_006965 [Zophobas morio]|uniref:Uncharacterized protein n=1 Tax=Zophobas morio TaxID=2755281 RepID=A0AA38IWE3_9CUCU|nr:hypothetical protein Zmor_006965 [Zophobas morio]
MGNKIVRGVHKEIKERNLRRRSTNQRLTDLYGLFDIVAEIIRWRVKWVGQLARLSGDKTAEVILVTGDETRKRRGRPRKMWLQRNDDKSGVGWSMSLEWERVYEGSAMSLALIYTCFFHQRNSLHLQKNGYILGLIIFKLLFCNMYKNP